MQRYPFVPRVDARYPASAEPGHGGLRSLYPQLSVDGTGRPMVTVPVDMFHGMQDELRELEKQLEASQAIRVTFAAEIERMIMDNDSLRLEWARQRVQREAENQRLQVWCKELLARVDALHAPKAAAAVPTGTAAQQETKECPRAREPCEEEVVSLRREISGLQQQLAEQKHFSATLQQELVVQESKVAALDREYRVLRQDTHSQAERRELTGTQQQHDLAEQENSLAELRNRLDLAERTAAELRLLAAITQVA